jgi:large subunit ribosomal protein L4e
MKVNILSIEGKKVEEFDAPKFFSNDVRKDLILRAVRSELSKKYQPKAPYKWAGLETSAEYVGNKDRYRTMKNRGGAMLPHEKLPKGRYGRVRMIPFAVTGRRAHPPKVEKIIAEKINNKEYQKALFSAISASCIPDVVKERTGSVYNVPYVMVDDIEKVNKSKDVLKMLETLGLNEEIEKSINSRKRITGFRKTRTGRAYKERRSVLFVVSNDCPLIKSGANLSGSAVVTVDKLTVNDLAPGGLPGRVVIWSKNSIQKLGEIYDNN